MIAVLLIPLLACPPTSIPARQQQGGHHLASPYGVPYEIEPTSVAPRSLSAPDVWLPLWNLDASLGEVSAQLAREQPPDWALWVAWALADASDREAHSHVIDALASSELSAEHLAWWRSITPDPSFALISALDRSKATRTRALLATTLALTEYARSCPAPVDVDGACRAPGTNLLLRRRTIPLESARQWLAVARKHWAKLDLDTEELATRALWAELELAVAAGDYEALLDAELPADLSFLVEDWRRDSGVREWEHEYERQLDRAKDSKARVEAWVGSTMDCARSQLDLHRELLWIDARSSGVVLLRNARISIAFADALKAEEERETIRVFGKNPKFICVGPSQSDSIYEQAHQYLELCLAHGRATLDEAIERACTATLARLDSDSRPLVEFTGHARATSTMQRHGVVASPD